MAPETRATGVIGECGRCVRAVRAGAASSSRSCCSAIARAAFLLLLLAGSAQPAGAAPKRVRITGLSDVAFGTIANLGVDDVGSQSVCIYSQTTTNGYNVTANGTGSGGAFQLASGANLLPFDVQWNSSAGQTNGTQLSPNVPLTGLVSSAMAQQCTSGPATSASLIIILRSAALASTTAGTYNGTLTLVFGPE